MFSKAYDAGQTPNEFVTETKKQHKLIMGIGHRVKSVINFDRCVQGRTLSFNPWTSQNHWILKLVLKFAFKINNPDKRVEILKKFVMENFPSHPLLSYALEVEKVTTKKVS